MKSICLRKINKTEPIQWGIDFLDNLIELIKNTSVTDLYCAKFLSSEYFLIREEFARLSTDCQNYNGILYNEGLPGGRLFTLRLLMSILFRTTISGPYETKQILRRLLEKELTQLNNYLKSLKFISVQKNSKHALVQKCINLLKAKGISPANLKYGNTPLLIVMLPYKEHVPGCYINPAHTIACYTNNLQELHPAQQIHVVLHEIGHLLCFRILKKEILFKKYMSMLMHLSPLLSAKKIDVRLLMSFNNKSFAEGFANLFALTLLQDTSTGEYLLSESYRVFNSEALSALKNFFLSAALFKPGPLHANNDTGSQPLDDSY